MVSNKKLTIPSVHELFQSLRTIRSDWSLKTPLQKWYYFYGISRASFIIPAITVFEYDQTLSLWIYQGFVYFGVYLAFVHSVLLFDSRRVIKMPTLYMLSWICRRC